MSGETLHQIATETIPVTTPALLGNQIVFFLNPHGYRGGAKVVASYDLALQKNIWRAEAATEWSSTRPYVWRESILVGNNVGEIYAYRAGDGVAQWSHAFGGVMRGIGIDERTIYAGTFKGMLYAFVP